MQVFETFFTGREVERKCFKLVQLVPVLKNEPEFPREQPLRHHMQLPALVAQQKYVEREMKLSVERTV